MAENAVADGVLIEWERERRASIKSAMDKRKLKLALALTLESQLALGLQTLSAGGFRVKVTPAPESKGMMPVSDIERFLREAQAHVSAKASGATPKDAAALAALESVFHLRTLLPRFRPGDASLEELYFTILLAAARCGFADAILAGERQGFFPDASAYRARKAAQSEEAAATNSKRKWWRAPAKEEWRRLEIAEPDLSIKARENRVVSFIKDHADGRPCPGAAGVRAARRNEKWDITQP